MCVRAQAPKFRTQRLSDCACLVILVAKEQPLLRRIGKCGRDDLGIMRSAYDSDVAERSLGSGFKAFEILSDCAAYFSHEWWFWAIRSGIVQTNLVIVTGQAHTLVLCNVLSFIIC